MITGNDSSIKKSIEMRNTLQRENNNNNFDNNSNNNFNMDSFNNGTQFFNMGGKLENAAGNLKQDKDFLNGYNRAQRVNIIRNHKSGRNI